MGKGSTESTVITQSIPKEFMDDFEAILGRASTESEKDYVPYEGQRIAGESADTQAAYQMVRDLAAAPTPGMDTAMSTASQNAAMVSGMIGTADPYQFSQYGGLSQAEYTPYAGYEASTFDPYAGFKAATFSPYAGFKEAQFSQYEGYNPYEYSTYGYQDPRMFGADAAAEYMDPYVQQVIDVQKAEMEKDYARNQAAASSAAVAAGAFGGSRSAVQSAISQDEMLDRMAEQDALLRQQAYLTAMNQFNADRAASMSVDTLRGQDVSRVQAGTAGERARVQSGEAAELARVEASRAAEAARFQEAQAAELARIQQGTASEAGRVQAGIAGELGRVQQGTAAEQARVQSGIASELARVQQGTADEMARLQQAEAADLARVQSAQAAEDRNAIATELEILGFSSEQAKLYAELETAARAGDAQAAAMLESIGKSQEARTQAELDVAYEDYLTQQNYEWDQINKYASLVLGLPVAPAGTQTTSETYSPLSQALGAVITGVSTYNAFQ